VHVACACVHVCAWACACMRVGVCMHARGRVHTPVLKMPTPSGLWGAAFLAATFLPPFLAAFFAPFLPPLVGGGASFLPNCAEAWRRSRVMRGRKVRSSVHKGARRSRRWYTDGRTRQRHADARGRRSIGVQGRRRRERRRCRFSCIAEAHQHERRHVGGGDRTAQHTGAHDRLEGGGQRHAHEQDEGAQHGERSSKRMGMSARIERRR